MDSQNPYRAPEADISLDQQKEFYHPSMFAIKGRIGRLRYLAYTYSIILLVALIGGIVFAGILQTSLNIFSPDLTSGNVYFWLIMVAVYVPILFFSFVYSIRRLNDIDRTGWLSLILLVPWVGSFFGLYLVFARGSEGTNDYGPAPDENPLWVKIIGIGLPVLFIVGIIVALVTTSYL